MVRFLLLTERPYPLGRVVKRQKFSLPVFLSFKIRLRERAEDENEDRSSEVANCGNSCELTINGGLLAIGAWQS